MLLTCQIDLIKLQVTMSTLTEDGISHVKQVACDRLLSSRVEVKLKVRQMVLLFRFMPH